MYFDYVVVDVVDFFFVGVCFVELFDFCVVYC